MRGLILNGPRRARAPHTGQGGRRSAGFSMIELLVAVLVMGIGVLGIAALQMVSLQNNRSAMVRAEAVALAYDMMDRVRANPLGAPAGAAYDGLEIEDDPPNATNCVANVCSQAEMVDFDRALWKCQLGAFNDSNNCENWRAAGLIAPVERQPGLPDGDGAVEVDGNGIVRVTVQWTDVDGQVQSVVIESQA